MDILLNTFANTLNNFVTWAKGTVPEKYKSEIKHLKLGEDEYYPLAGLKALFENLTENEKEDFNIVNSFMVRKANFDMVGFKEVSGSMSPKSHIETFITEALKHLSNNEVDYVGKKNDENVFLNTSKMFVDHIDLTDFLKEKLESFKGLVNPVNDNNQGSTVFNFAEKVDMTQFAGLPNVEKIGQGGTNFGKILGDLTKENNPNAQVIYITDGETDNIDFKGIPKMENMGQNVKENPNVIVKPDFLKNVERIRSSDNDTSVDNKANKPK